MRDLKIRPGMDTPKAKLKNPTPKDAESILKKHMDKRQKEKEPESRDPVRYATDRVEKNMRRGASGAADASRRMIKHYRGKLRQGKENAIRTHSAAETPDRAIGSENVFIDTPMEYAFSPVQTAARNEVGNRTISPQNCGGPKSANAAPQERGRQKAAQDAKAAYRRNLAEKKTAERHIVPPPSDRGGTMTTPQKGNSGASAKGSPAPKSGQAMTKATRTMRVRPTDHAAPNNAIITHRARAAAQRKAQRAMLQDSVKNGGNAAKKLSGTAVQAIKAMGRGVASAVSSILSAGGGAVVLVLILTVILVAAIVASPFGILFSNESREAGVVPLSAAVAQVNYEFNERLEALQTAADYDSISIEGQAADWAEVLALWQAQRGDTEEFVRGAVERFAGVQNVYVAEENDHIEAVALAVPVTLQGRPGSYLFGLCGQGSLLLAGLVDTLCAQQKLRGAGFVVAVPASPEQSTLLQDKGFQKAFALRCLPREVERNLWSQAEFDSVTAKKLCELRAKYWPDTVQLPPEQMGEVLRDLYSRGATIVSSEQGYGIPLSLDY